MDNYGIYQNIATRTNGDIYIGVVGPVRTGKSTFIKNFMNTAVLPNIKNEYKRRLNNVLQLFNDIDIIEISDEKFDIIFDRNNYYTYYMIMICKLINDCTMLSEDPGKYKCIDILDDDNRMSKIFELFISYPLDIVPIPITTSVFLSSRFKSPINLYGI